METTKDWIQPCSVVNLMRDFENLTLRVNNLEKQLELKDTVTSKCAYEVPITKKESNPVGAFLDACANEAQKVKTQEQLNEFAAEAAIRNHERIAHLVDILSRAKSDLGGTYLLVGKTLTGDTYIKIQNAYLDVKRALEIAQGIK